MLKIGQITAGPDRLDLRDITDRVDALESLVDTDEVESDWRQELKDLHELLTELEDNGGDHEWRGHWYPLELIHEDHFEWYARDLAEDVEGIGNRGWPFDCIDWNMAAEALKQDYSEVEWCDQTYLYR